MFWAEETNALPIAEKIRRYFMNQNTNRKPAVDMDSDSSADELGFDESFERILTVHRAKRQAAADSEMRHTPDRMPATSSTSSHAPTTSHDVDMSAAMHRLDLNASQRLDEDEETQLFDVPEPSMFERLSPVKRVGLLRPSTVLEDSCEEQNDTAQSSSASVAESHPDGAAGTSFETAYTAAPRAAHETSFETARSAVRSTDGGDDDDNCSTGSAAYARDSLAISANRSLDEDSLDRVPPAALDDTLEVVEYDRTTPRYVLKPVRKTSPTDHRVSQCAPAADLAADDAADAVICLDSDSSPETSFHTARTNANQADSPARSGRCPTTARSSLFPHVKRSFYTDELLTGSVRDEFASCANQSVISLVSSDGDAGDEDEDGGPVAATPLPIPDETPFAVREPCAPTSGDLDDSLSLDATIPDQFNDTIERMDYLMEQGRRIQRKAAQQSASKASPMPKATRTPPVLPAPARSAFAKPLAHTIAAATRPLASGASPATDAAAAAAATKKLFRTPVAKNSPLLKAKPSGNSPALGPKPTTPSNPTPAGGVFKKPLLLAGPPSAGRRTPAASSASAAPSITSRIPLPRSAGKMAYDYVRSPIGAYIGQRAPNPMVQNVIADRDFQDTSYYARAAATEELDFTLPAANGENVPPPQTALSLPQRLYKPASRKLIIDQRQQVVPGGASVQKLIGTVPTMTLHQRRPANGRLDEPDSSHSAGDVSVLIVHNCKK